MLIPICKASGDCVPFGKVEVSTIEDLFALIKEYGDAVILSDEEDGPMLTIYDNYIE